MQKLFLLIAFWLPLTAFAHSFVRPYNLPVPMWMYLYGSATALALSFLVAAVFLRHPEQADSPNKFFNLSATGVGRCLHKFPWKKVFGSIAFIALLLACISGFFGHASSKININMTLFWIVFILGFAYLVAIVGDIFKFINPWKNLSLLLGKLWFRFIDGFYNYPVKVLGYFPALILYMAFIWVELFAQTKPLSLSVYLLAYTGINIIGSLLWGVKSWFRYGELFSVFLRLIGLMAPVKYVDGKVKLRWPFSGLAEEKAESLSLVIFILFMLSSTAYDGIRETVPWNIKLWANILFALEPDFAHADPRVTILRSFTTDRELYTIFQTGSMLLSPFLYLAVYWLFVWLGKVFTRSSLNTYDLALRFAYSLLPIALVYHFTHYYTLLMTQGLKIFPMLSDPFGKRWDLFGTADWFRYAVIPDVGTVWHVQVILIVLGHIAGVYYSHKAALQAFGSAKKATISQIPMLILMMLFTGSGLWILGQPIQAGT